MTTLVDDVAKAIEAKQQASLSVNHNPGQIDPDSLARAAIAVIARYLRESNEELTELFVEHRDGSFGWRKFYLELASHLEEPRGD